MQQSHSSVQICFPSLSLSSFKHLQIHAQWLLNRVFGDELDKVIDISLSVRRQLVYGWLPHHGLCELSGVICKWNKWTFKEFLYICCALIYNFFYEYWDVLEFIAKYKYSIAALLWSTFYFLCGKVTFLTGMICWKLILFFRLLHILPSTRIY